MPARWSDPSHAARPLTDWQQPAGGAAGPSPSAPNSDLQQATFTESANSASASPSGPPNSFRAGAPDRPLSTAPQSLPADSAAAPLASAAKQLGSAGKPADCTAQFSAIERRLRELGSTYYLLEAWGPATEQYRFICHVPLAGSAKYSRTRIFEATSPSPIEAMQEVLTQVERWRSNGQQ